jgi:hypothetical protein
MSLKSLLPGLLENAIMGDEPHVWYLMGFIGI